MVSSFPPERLDSERTHTQTFCAFLWVGTNSGMDYWNGTLDWTTGLDYWTELFFFFGQVSEFIFGSLIFMIYKYRMA